MRIAVIGGTGHVGTYLVPRLVRGGHEVVALSRGEREPYHPAPEWGAVARLAVDRDAEGAIWVADALGGPVLRVREGGEILEEISPGTGVFACALGGADGRTLVMCAAPSFAEHERRPVREAQLLAVRVDVPHAGLP